MIPTILLPVKDVTLTANEARLYEAALKGGAGDQIVDYAATWIAEDFKTDYELQISKWNGATHTVVSAFATAVYNHIQILKAADELEQFKWELALFVLSVASGSSLRWVGATIQYRHAAKLIKADNKYSQVWGSFLGGTAEDIGKVAFDSAASKFAPAPLAVSRFQPQDIEPFRTGLLNTLEAAKQLFLSELAKLARSIRETKDFGERWLKQAKGNKEVAKELIRVQLGFLRLNWSERFLYYGNDPNLRPTPQLVEEMERQLWATCIRNMNLTRFAKRPTNALGEPRGGTTISSVVINKLRELNVVKEFPFKGQIVQAARVGATGAPKPSILVWGDANEQRELVALGEWAATYRCSQIEMAIPWRRRDIGPVLKMFDRH